MVLEEVRYEGKHNKLLFKVLIEPDAFIISTMCRESKEPVQIDMGSIISPYVDSETMNIIKGAWKSIYDKKSEELS